MYSTKPPNLSLQQHKDSLPTPQRCYLNTEFHAVAHSVSTEKSEWSHLQPSYLQCNNKIRKSLRP